MITSVQERVIAVKYARRQSINMRDKGGYRLVATLISDLGSFSLKCHCVAVFAANFASQLVGSDHTHPSRRVSRTTEDAGSAHLERLRAECCVSAARRLRSWRRMKALRVSLEARSSLVTRNVKRRFSFLSNCGACVQDPDHLPATPCAAHASAR